MIDSRIRGDQMIFIVSSENRLLFDTDLTEMHRQRKAVFVDGIGWKIPVVHGMEIDRYDREDTTYLIAKDAPNGPVLASVRLLPTIGPHLMSDLFLEACQGAPRCGPEIWEVSRFCITPGLRSRRRRIALVWEIICGVTETALLFGIEQVTFATNAALLPLVLNCGWSVAPLGPTLPDGDDEITAVAASITPDGLRNVRRRFRVAAPVTRFLAQRCASDEPRCASDKRSAMSDEQRCASDERSATSDKRRKALPLPLGETWGEGARNACF